MKIKQIEYEISGKYCENTKLIYMLAIFFNFYKYKVLIYINVT